MYLSTRVMRANGTRVPEAVALVSSIVEHINANHGSDFGVGTQIGGDPSAIGVSCGWENLGDYQAFLDSMGADESMPGRVAAADGLLMPADAEDAIWSILRPPGEPQEFTSVSSANVRISQIADALAFALEVAEYSSGLTGSDAGVAMALTGDRSRLIWVSHAADMAEIQETGDALNADAGYLDFFKRSEGLFIESSLAATIWRRIG